jgi:hypothetical protein
MPKHKKRTQSASAKSKVLELPKSTTEVVTEKTYVTTKPEVEIKQPGTLAQALTEPAVAVVKPKRTVRKEIASRTRRSS